MDKVVPTSLNVGSVTVPRGGLQGFGVQVDIQMTLKRWDLELRKTSGHSPRKNEDLTGRSCL